MKTSLGSQDINALVAPLADAEQRFARHFPGESGARQPVHTVYGGAHLFKAGTAKKLGDLALSALATYAPDPSEAKFEHGELRLVFPKAESAKPRRIQISGAGGQDAPNGTQKAVTGTPTA